MHFSLSKTFILLLNFLKLTIHFQMRLYRISGSLPTGQEGTTPLQLLKKLQICLKVLMYCLFKVSRTVMHLKKCHTEDGGGILILLHWVRSTFISCGEFIKNSCLKFPSNTFQIMAYDCFPKSNHENTNSFTSSWIFIKTIILRSNGYHTQKCTFLICSRY